MMLRFDTRSGDLAVAHEHVAAVYPQANDPRSTIIMFSSGRTMIVSHPASVVTDMLNAARTDKAPMLIEAYEAEAA